MASFGSHPRLGRDLAHEPAFAGSGDCMGRMDAQLVQRHRLAVLRHQLEDALDRLQFFLDGLAFRSGEPLVFQVRGYVIAQEIEVFVLGQEGVDLLLLCSGPAPSPLPTARRSWLSDTPSPFS